jgi:hypothetical protein
MTSQRILLVVLLAWALVMIVPDLLRVVQPLGSFGFYANNDGLIYDVVGPFDEKEQSPAWNAGIRAGDRLAINELHCYPYDATTCRNALTVLSGHQFMLPGRTATVQLKPPVAAQRARSLWWRSKHRPTPSSVSSSCSSLGSWSWSGRHGSSGHVQDP